MSITSMSSLTVFHIIAISVKYTNPRCKNYCPHTCPQLDKVSWANDKPQTDDVFVSRRQTSATGTLTAATNTNK